jgi:hypothetical protein
MPYEPQPNTGSLFLEGKAKTSKTGNPYTSYSGSIFVECPHCKQQSLFWLNGFKKKIPLKAGGNAEIMDLRINPKAAKTQDEQIKANVDQIAF